MHLSLSWRDPYKIVKGFPISMEINMKHTILKITIVKTCHKNT